MLALDLVGEQQPDSDAQETTRRGDRDQHRQARSNFSHTNLHV
jgi:hypothetical protein